MSKNRQKISVIKTNSFDWELLTFDNTVKLGNMERFDKELIGIKEPFPVTNLPFSCTHLPLWRGKVKDPRYMQNKKDSRISLPQPTRKITSKIAPSMYTFFRNSR